MVDILGQVIHNCCSYLLPVLPSGGVQALNQAGGVTEKHCVAGRPRHHAVDVDGQVVVVFVFIEVVDGHVVVFDGDKGGDNGGQRHIS